MLGKLVPGFGHNQEGSEVTQECSQGLGLMIFLQPGSARTPARGARLGARSALALARLAGPRGFAGACALGPRLRTAGAGRGAGAARRRGFANCGIWK